MLPNKAEIWPNFVFAAETSDIAEIWAKFWGIWLIRTVFMTIFDLILAYFWSENGSFSCASASATGEVLNIFGQDENHQKR